MVFYVSLQITNQRHDIIFMSKFQILSLIHIIENQTGQSLFERDALSTHL